MLERQIIITCYAGTLLLLAIMFGRAVRAAAICAALMLAAMVVWLLFKLSGTAGL